MSQVTFFPVLEKFPVVSFIDNQLTTTSLNVAEVFNKTHSDVLKSVRALLLEIPKDLGEGNFALSSYTSEQNKKQPMYILTQDGFTLLAMGYTGKTAIQF